MISLEATVSVADVAIEKEIYESGTTALIVSNEEMEDIMKIVKSPEGSIKGISETVKNETCEPKTGLLGILVGMLAASLLVGGLTAQRVVKS